MLWCLTKKNSPNKKHTPKIVRMAHIMCILALLCFASCVAENTETEQGFKDHHLQQNSLSWLDKLQDNQVRCLYFYLIQFLFCLNFCLNISIEELSFQWLKPGPKSQLQLCCRPQNALPTDFQKVSAYAHIFYWSWSSKNLILFSASHSRCCQS